jgi:hypothetical protein
MRTATPYPSLVPPETHALAYLAKWALRAVLLLGVMVALASQATAAPVVFEASGEFEDGTYLEGSITIDTATGKVLSADLIINNLPGGGESVFTPSSTTHTKNTTTMVFAGSYVHEPARLQLTLPVSTLVDYEGGGIQWESSYYDVYGSLKAPTPLAFGTLKSTGTEPPLD